MSYFEYVNCPYCNEEVDCETVEFDGYDKVDYECNKCGKEFEIEREWYPSYGANKIEYSKCEECKQEERNDNMFRKFREGMDIYLCRTCYFKEEIKKFK